MDTNLFIQLSNTLAHLSYPSLCLGVLVAEQLRNFILLYVEKSVWRFHDYASALSAPESRTNKQEDWISWAISLK